MSNFNDQLARMKDLWKYGSVNENAKPISSYNIEYKAQAADGKFYGIIRENSKYYVKVATPGKEMVAESYQYIGGIQNKKNYEYGSYANALKQFELKLGSINEAYDENRRVNVEALDPFKKEDLVVEGTEKFKNELARQRQIMRNASVIMNEATEIGSTPFKTQPEAEHANSGDKDYPFTKEGKAEEDRGAIKFGEGSPEKHSATFGPDSNDVEDYDLDKGATPKVKDSVASEHPSGGKVARVNEGVAECGIPECGGPMAGALPEEGDEDFDLGGETDDMPADAHNDIMAADDVTPAEGEEDDLDLGDDELEDGFGDDEEEFGDDELELGDEEEDEFGDEEEDEFGDEEEGDEDFDLGDEDDDEFDFEDEDEDFGDEEGEFDDEEEGDFEDEEDDEFDDEEDPEIELDENVVRKFRKLVRESINEMFGDENGREDCFDQFGRDANDAKFDESLPDDEDEEDDEEDMDWKLSSISEAKAAKMNSIVESVVNDILNEDELHVFGDHPGYRKKPMDLPPTGSDKFQDNRDWNDDSVHSEEPFGKGKGDSTPFDILVAQITDSVMKQISEDKKKVK